MRRTVRAALLGLISLVALASGAQAGGGPTISPLGSATFPDRAYVLTLPPGVDAPGAVTVTENGKPVTGLAVVPADGSAGSVASVLLIDASESMHGRPEHAALVAARAFAAQRRPDQALAIITFNRTPQVALPLTTDAAQINAALKHAPRLATGTRIYDAVDAALAMLRRAHVASGSIVLLSDGSDTGSTAGLGEVASVAHAGGVRIFAVGLRSHTYERSTLAGLAGNTGGAYAETASPSQLRRIFARLGDRLAHQWIIRYRSTAGPSARVRVDISVAGMGAAVSTAYVTPSLDVSGPAVYHPGIERIWRSPVALFLVVLLAAGLIGAFFAFLTRPRHASVRARLAEFVSLPSRRTMQAQSAVFVDRLSATAERRLGRSNRWARFRQDVEVAGISIPAERLLAWTAVGTVFAGVLLVLILGTPLAVFLAVIVPLGVRQYVYHRLGRRRATFADQLPDNLQVLASALRAGHSFTGALSVVVEDAPEPAHSEFSRVIADEQLGVSLEDSLRAVAHRMASVDMEQIALVAALQQETGGNTAEVLESVTQTIRERAELRRMVKALTAQGRASRWIVSALPVCLLAVLSLINPHYLSPLFTHSAGKAMLIASALLVVAGSLVIKKIVDIEI
jgi:tight adherence protein B